MTSANKEIVPPTKQQENARATDESTATGNVLEQ
jgi:hypothetical protein